MEKHNATIEIGKYIEGCFKQPSIQHQHLSGIGAVNKLSKKLCDFYKKKFALTFCNATTALQTICFAMDLKNSEIISSPINWGGSIAPFLFQGNKICFTSVDSASLNLDVNDLQSAITPHTKAVLSVDYNGNPADSKAIKNFCEQHGLKYISDSAQSFGSYRDEKPAGNYSNAIVLSFSPGKTLFGGEGGAVITDDQSFFEKMVYYSQHPSKQKTVFGISNYNQYAPINGRMNPFSAIFLNETFDLSLQNLKNHQNQYFEITKLLEDEELIEINEQIVTPQSSTFFNFTVKMKPNVTSFHINEFLDKQCKPFLADNILDKLIPFDPLFKMQFKGCFYCTKSLSHHRNSDLLKNWVKINYVP